MGPTKKGAMTKITFRISPSLPHLLPLPICRLLPLFSPLRLLPSMMLSSLSAMTTSPSSSSSSLLPLSIPIGLLSFDTICKSSSLSSSLSQSSPPPFLLKPSPVLLSPFAFVFIVGATAESPGITASSPDHSVSLLLDIEIHLLLVQIRISASPHLSFVSNASSSSSGIQLLHCSNKLDWEALCEDEDDYSDVVYEAEPLDVVVDEDIELEIEKTGCNYRRIRSEIRIEAPLATVWSLLTDYKRLADFIPGLAVCQLLEKSENYARLFQIGEQDLAFGMKFNTKGVVDCYENALERVENDILELLVSHQSIPDDSIEAVSEDCSQLLR